MDVCDDIKLSRICRRPEMQELCKQTGATAIISTGIWPGASSLFAKKIIDQAGGVENVDRVVFSFHTSGSGKKTYFAQHDIAQSFRLFYLYSRITYRFFSLFLCRRCRTDYFDGDVPHPRRRRADVQRWEASVPQDRIRSSVSILFYPRKP